MPIPPAPPGPRRLLVIGHGSVALVHPASPLGSAWSFLREQHLAEPASFGSRDAERMAVAALDSMEDGEVPPMAEDTAALPISADAWIVRRPGDRWAMTGSEMAARDLAFGDDRAVVLGPQPVPSAVMDIEVDLGARGYEHRTVYLARHSAGWLLTTDAAEAVAWLGGENGLIGTVHRTSDNAVAAATLRAVNGAVRPRRTR